MAKPSAGGIGGRLRRLVGGDHPEAIRRLERQIEEVRRDVRDPALARALLIEALREGARSQPAELVEALAPVIEEVARQRAVTTSPGRTRHRWPWVCGLAAALVSGAGLISWEGYGTALSDTADKSVSAAISPPSMPVVVVVEERGAGFGLARAAAGDDALARAVRTRLTACEELADATVNFSVKDGWVWLRGQATESGREAAARALDDLGEGVFVVNQLAVTPSAQILAEK